MSQGVIAQHPEALQGRDTEDGATAVQWASLLGHAELVEWLIEQGAPHDWAVESSGMQPIHWAATRGHTDVIKVLLKRGANHTGPTLVTLDHKVCRSKVEAPALS